MTKGRAVARVTMAGWLATGKERKGTGAPQHYRVDSKEGNKPVKKKEKASKKLQARMVSGTSEEEKNNFETFKRHQSSHELVHL